MDVGSKAFDVSEGLPSSCMPLLGHNLATLVLHQGGLGETTDSLLLGAPEDHGLGEAASGNLAGALADCLGCLAAQNATLLQQHKAKFLCKT